jgi:copper chaperone
MHRQRFTVRGMTCDHCKMAVTSELARLDGVAHVDVDVAAGSVVVESAAPLVVSDVAAAVDEAGYELAS